MAKRVDEHVDEHRTDIYIDEEPIDPERLVILFHKPVGFVCSHKEQGRIIYELLPERFAQRKPLLTSVGRLDKDSSGLLILTNDGALNHTLTQPKKVGKKYSVTLREPLRGDEAELFSSGTFVLPEETDPLLPAHFEPTSSHTGILTIYEGKYRQIRRMFAAVENEVRELHRFQIGTLQLGDLEVEQWKHLSEDELASALKNG